MTERERFEEWYAGWLRERFSYRKPEFIGKIISTMLNRLAVNDEYCAQESDEMWQAWQARARLDDNDRTE